ncbi:hypothetical protein GCM10009080_24670 [Cupriavidus pauculus]
MDMAALTVATAAAAAEEGVGVAAEGITRCVPVQRPASLPDVPHLTQGDTAIVTTSTSVQ